MNTKLSKEILRKAYSLMCCAREMSIIYEVNKDITSKYVHATSKGHEAIQLAIGLQLTSNDWVAPYYRDDSILLGIGMQPYELMLQLLSKKDDPFSGGRTYYSHPSLNRNGYPKIPHQSSATGMQAIPTTGVAMGIQYQEKEKLTTPKRGEEPVVVCSFGDAAISNKHTNFFINKGNASYKDMKKLIDYVKESVKNKTGVNLDLEIILVE